VIARLPNLVITLDGGVELSMTPDQYTSEIRVEQVTIFLCSDVDDMFIDDSC
jgi:hypothetical protein